MKRVMEARQLDDRDLQAEGERVDADSAPLSRHCGVFSLSGAWERRSAWVSVASLMVRRPSQRPM